MFTDKKVMSVLRLTKKARMDGSNWQIIRMNPSHEDILQKLELIPKPDESQKRRAEHPIGSRNKPKTNETSVGVG